MKRLCIFLIVLIAVSYICLAIQDDFRFAVGSLVMFSGAVLAGLMILIFLLEKRNFNIPVWVILLCAFSFRMLFLFREPELSDDIFRYVWDGLQTIHAINPYTAAPLQLGDPVTGAGIIEKINHPEYMTIYPPFAQALFAFAMLIYKSVTCLKALLVLFDIAACWLIIRLLSCMNIPVSRSILYAWHPLPVIEIAGSGHVDGVGLTLFLAVLYLMYKAHHSSMDIQAERIKSSKTREKVIWLLCGFLFSAAVLVKFMVLIFFPFLYIISKKQKIVILGFVAGACIVSLPFMPELLNISHSLLLYLRNWEFSNFAFRTLRNCLSSGDRARLVLTVLFTLIAMALYIRLFINTKNDGREKAHYEMMTACYYMALSFLLCSPTLYPWYVLYPVVLFPFAAGPAGILLSWTVLFSYQVIPGYTILQQWHESDFFSAVIWIVPVAAGLLSIIITRMSVYSRMHNIFDHGSIRQKGQSL